MANLQIVSKFTLAFFTCKNKNFINDQVELNRTIFSCSVHVCQNG